jgi:copper(I)-binding protein
MHFTMRRLMPAVALTAALSLSLAACGSDDSDATEPSPSPTMSGAMATTPDGASATVGDFALTGFWVKESSLDLSAGFGTITNNGTEADALVGASAPGVPMIEMHETVDGVMQQVESFPIPAGGSLTLAPGGNHLMFMGLTEPLAVGETIDITLSFESGQTAMITAPIEPFSGDDGHDHL